MPAKTTKKVVNNTPKGEQVAEPPKVEELKVEAPKVVPPVEEKKEPKKKAGKKAEQPKPEEKPVEKPVVAPVVTPAVAPVEEPQPVVPTDEKKTPKKKVTKKTVKKTKKSTKGKTVVKKAGKKIVKKVKVPKKKSSEPEIKLSDENKKRFFKLIYGDDTVPIGRFSGKKPKQAANKAHTSIVKSLEDQGKQVIGVDIKFALKECTRWNKKKCKKDSNGDKVDKIYHYVGKRELLPEKVPVDHVQKKDIPVEILKVGKVLNETTLPNGAVKTYIEAKVGELRKFISPKNKDDNDVMKIIVKKTTDGKYCIVNEIVYKHTNKVSKYKPDAEK